MQPPGHFQKEDVYTRKRWRRVQYLANQFWSKWKREYLANLQMRQKWNKKQRNIQVGDVVLLKEEYLVRSHWNLARVVETMPSKDNLVRKVRLLVADSSLTKQGKRTKKFSIWGPRLHLCVTRPHRICVNLVFFNTFTLSAFKHR